jgi:hypothetical protein
LQGLPCAKRWNLGNDLPVAVAFSALSELYIRQVFEATAAQILCINGNYLTMSLQLISLLTTCVF